MHIEIINVKRKTKDNNIMKLNVDVKTIKLKEAPKSQIGSKPTLSNTTCFVNLYQKDLV